MEKKLDIKFDSTIPKVLFDNKLTIIFSTYQAGRLMMIGSSDGYNIQQTPIAYKKPMGIAVDENRLLLRVLMKFRSTHQMIKLLKKLI